MSDAQWVKSCMLTASFTGDNVLHVRFISAATHAVPAWAVACGRGTPYCRRVSSNANGTHAGWCSTIAPPRGYGMVGGAEVAEILLVITGHESAIAASGLHTAFTNEADARALRRAMWGNPTKEETVFVETVDDHLFHCVECAAALTGEDGKDLEDVPCCECDHDGCQACVCMGCAGELEEWVCQWHAAAPAAE